MHLTKHHGLGNDFLVARCDAVPADAAALARSWCHRTRGVGADGLIFVTPSARADARMTLVNADGSFAEISGNGIRCLAQAVCADTGRRSLRIDTPAGLRSLEVSDTDDAATVEVAVDMGVVEEGPALVDLPHDAPYGLVRAATADIGNPHVVLEVVDGGAVDLATDGPAIEARFGPSGINVHFLTPIGDDTISLRHWERGAGITEACGSGATVSAAIAHRWGLVGPEVTVAMPGGRARVLLGATALLVGPATFVCEIGIERRSDPAPTRLEAAHG